MSREDFLSVLDSNRTDIVPLYLFDVTLGMELAGIDTDEVFINGLDGEKSAKSLIASCRHFGLDATNGAVLWFDNRIFGNKVEFPKKGIPYNSAFALADPSSLYKLDNSAIPKGLLDQLALSHRLVSEGTDAALVNHTPSPLGAASSLRGLQDILMDMMQEPDYLRELLRFCSETTEIVYGYISNEADIDLCLISGAYDNVDIIGEQSLKEFSSAYLVDTVRFAKDSGARVCFHPHGYLSGPPTKDIVREYQDMGIDCLYYGENNDPVRIHEFAPRMSIMGGVDTFTTITLGNDNRVRMDTERCLGAMKDASYIFSCSCSVDRGLSVDKLNIMCETVRRFSTS